MVKLIPFNYLNFNFKLLILSFFIIYKLILLSNMNNRLDAPSTSKSNLFKSIHSKDRVPAY